MSESGPSSSSYKRAKDGVQVKAGSNWKRLQKTLISNDGSEERPYRKKSKTASTTWTSSKPHPKGRLLTRSQETSSEKASSPAPTALPWFAEDLSPEDLALVGSSGSSDGSLKLEKGAHALGNGEEDGVEAMKLKKRVILGGEDLPSEKSEPGTYIAIDCEMVGVGPMGSESILARVSIVNWHGAKLYDTFVRPKEKVTDYRTWVSGVRPDDLRRAPQFDEVQARVAELIKGKVLIGHAVQNDLKALLLSHPRPLLRDTSTFHALRQAAKTKYPALRTLSQLVLGIEIQKKGQEHSSLEDARATMAIYRRFHAAWQKELGIHRRGVLHSAERGKKRKVNDASIAGDRGHDVPPEGGDGQDQAKMVKKPSRDTSKKSSGPPSGWWKEL